MPRGSGAVNNWVDIISKIRRENQPYSVLNTHDLHKYIPQQNIDLWKQTGITKGGLVALTVNSHNFIMYLLTKGVIKRVSWGQYVVVPWLPLESDITIISQEDAQKYKRFYDIVQCNKDIRKVRWIRIENTKTK